MRATELAAQEMVAILKLKALPVAVNFNETENGIYSSAKKMRYCQALMLARGGKEVVLTPENISCPAAAAAFGFKPLPDKITQGEMLANLGLFAEPGAASHTMALMPRLELGKYKAVCLTPLSKAESTIPDVIVIEGLPEQVMWIILASIFNTGGRLNFETGVFQATCVDATVVPFITGKVNACFGCYGCREASDIDLSEAVMGFPGRMLEGIVEALSRLEAKALPRARAKSVYKIFAKEW